MTENIEYIQFMRDDQIPKSVRYTAVHQQFRLDALLSGFVELEGPNLVIEQKEKVFYLLFRDAPRELLEQLYAILKQVSITMYMRVPLSGAESIVEKEKFLPPKFAEKIRRMGRKLTPPKRRAE